MKNRLQRLSTQPNYSKDAIEVRLQKFLAETDDEMLDQERFQEECQLIIARHALGKSLHHSMVHSEAWKDVTWMGKAATDIGAMFNRRVQAECELVRKRASSARAVEFVRDFKQLNEKIHSLDVELVAMAKEVGELRDKNRLLDRELRTAKSELADRILSARIEYERLVAETEEAKALSKSAELARKSAIVAFEQLSLAMEALHARHGEAITKLAELEEVIAAQKIRETELSSEISRQEEHNRAIQAEHVRSLQAVRFQLEQERLKAVDELRTLIQEKETVIIALEEAAARAVAEARAFAVDLCSAQSECAGLRRDVDVARAHVTALARGAARIGHFSMRVGGGYATSSARAIAIAARTGASS